MHGARLWNSRIVRFLVVGGMGTAFSYGVFAFFLFLGLNYALTSLFAIVAGILFSFKTQGTFVFRNNDSRLLGRFILCWGVIYVAYVVFIARMIAVGVNKYVAGALAIPAVAVLSYLVQRFLVFRPEEP